MEIESLFSSTRWEILKELSKQELSPMQLAGLMTTTSANISQQLRLLELAGLVKSVRTQNIEKGKPRIVYSLAGNNAFLIIAAKKYTEKKLLPLSPYHNFVLKTWFLDNVENHIVLNEFYLKFHKNFPDFDILAVVDGFKECLIYIVAQKLSDSLQRALKDFKSGKVMFVDREKLPSNSLLLYEKNEVSKYE